MQPLKATLTPEIAVTSETERTARGARDTEDDNPQKTWDTRASGRWRWRIDPAWTGLVTGADSPDWACLDSDPNATRVKANDGREVWRYETDTHLLFVKVARPPRKWPRVRRFLQGCPADHECRVADYAREHGIDTVQPIAAAQAPMRGRDPVSIFITIGVRKAVALNERWSALDPAAPDTRKMKNRIIDVTARLIAWAHQNGFAHLDLHAGNMLIEQAGDDCRAVFVDLNNVRLGRRVRERAIVRNLAQFNQWFRWNATLIDRIRFLDRYIDWHRRFEQSGTHSLALHSDRKRLLALLERAALRHAAKLNAKRDRRAMRNGRYFSRITLDKGWHAHVFLSAKHAWPTHAPTKLKFDRAQWQHWLEDPEAWFTPEDRSWIIKDSRTAMVCRQRLTTRDGHSFDTVCKRSLPRTLLRRLIYLFRTSRPMLTWKRGNALLSRQIPTARPLAVVERRRFGLLIDSFVVTEHLDHALDLDTLLTVKLRQASDATRRSVKNAIVADLATVLSRLYASGFTHRDLKAPNVMVQWDPDLAMDPRVLLVDLDGLHRVRRATMSRQIRGLTRLNISLDHCKRATLTDRARFLKRYLRAMGNPDPDIKPLWRQIAARSARLRRSRHRQQQKMLARYGRF